MSNNSNVYLVHGDKGGPGKSLVADVFADWLLNRGIEPVIVDADMRNPDVARMFEGSPAQVVLINLREADGWLELSSVIEEAGERPVLINLPGNIGDEVEKRVPALAEALQALKKDAYMLWVLNREPDSVNLLRVATAAFGDVLKRTVAVRNLHFGDAAKFSRWNDSNVKKAFTDAGGLEVDLEDLNDRCVDATKRAIPKAVRFSDADAAKDPETGGALRFGHKSELVRWTQATFRTFDGIASKIGLNLKAAAKGAVEAPAPEAKAV